MLIGKMRNSSSMSHWLGTTPRRTRNGYQIIIAKDSGILRASETGMTFSPRYVIPVLDERSEGQIPESSGSLEQLVLSF